MTQRKDDADGNGECDLMSCSTFPMIKWDTGYPVTTIWCAKHNRPFSKVGTGLQTPPKHIHKYVIPVESKIDKGSDSYQSMTTGTYFPATPDRIYVTKLRCECGSEVER